MTKSILVVDDNKICNFLTVNALKKEGGFGDIEDVINGLEAINLLKETPQFPNLILLDINMPVMDGLDMYTSSIRETDKEVAFRCKDVFDFINKPLTNEKLIDLINKI